MINKRDPQKRARLDDQWDIRRDISASAETILVNPSIAMTNNLADLKKLQKAEDLSETYMARKQKAFTRAQHERIQRRVEQTMGQEHQEMGDQELLKGL